MAATVAHDAPLLTLFWTVDAQSKIVLILRTEGVWSAQASTELRMESVLDLFLLLVALAPMDFSLVRTGNATELWQDVPLTTLMESAQNALSLSC